MARVMMIGFFDFIRLNWLLKSTYNEVQNTGLMTIINEIKLIVLIIK